MSERDEKDAKSVDPVWQLEQQLAGFEAQARTADADMVPLAEPEWTKEKDG